MSHSTRYEEGERTNLERFRALVDTLAREWRKMRPNVRSSALLCLYRAVERFQFEGLGKEAYEAMEPLRS